MQKNESNENGDADQDDEEQANAQVEEETTETAASTSFNVNMIFLEDMWEKLRESKKRCEIHMIPFFVKMENTVAEVRHKCLKHAKQKQEETLRKQKADGAAEH